LKGLSWSWSYDTTISSTNKTDRHNIAEILLKVALNTINNKQTINIDSLVHGIYLITSLLMYIYEYLYLGRYGVMLLLYIYEYLYLWRYGVMLLLYIYEYLYLWRYGVMLLFRYFSLQVWVLVSYLLWQAIIASTTIAIGN
jgi:hypothetical protein